MIELIVLFIAAVIGVVVGCIVAKLITYIEDN